MKTLLLSLLLSSLPLFPIALAQAEEFTESTDESLNLFFQKKISEDMQQMEAKAEQVEVHPPVAFEEGPLEDETAEDGSDQSGETAVSVDAGTGMTEEIVEHPEDIDEDIQQDLQAEQNESIEQIESVDQASDSANSDETDSDERNEKIQKAEKTDQLTTDSVALMKDSAPQRSSSRLADDSSIDLNQIEKKINESGPLLEVREPAPAKSSDSPSDPLTWKRGRS